MDSVANYILSGAGFFVFIGLLFTALTFWFNRPEQHLKNAKDLEENASVLKASPNNVDPSELNLLISEEYRRFYESILFQHKIYAVASWIILIPVFLVLGWIGYYLCDTPWNIIVSILCALCIAILLYFGWYFGFRRNKGMNTPGR